MSCKTLSTGQKCLLAGVLLVLAVYCGACKKDYYQDSGLQIGKYEGSSLAYLQSKPYFFDTLVTVIKLAGLERVLQDSAVTFFAPTDYSVKKAMNIVHAQRYSQFKDSLKLEQVPPEVWRRFLSRYIFRDKYMLKDIPRLAFEQKELYPGMNLESWQGYIMCLGVNFSDYNGTRDVGPRTLVLGDMGDLGNPRFLFGTVASSDMRTNNGVVHVMNADHAFGFSSFDFANMVDEYLK